MVNVNTVPALGLVQFRVFNECILNKIRGLSHITDQSGHLMDPILYRVHYDLKLLAPSVFCCIE